MAIAFKVDLVFFLNAILINAAMFGSYSYVDSNLTIVELDEGPYWFIVVLTFLQLFLSFLRWV